MKASEGKAGRIFLLRLERGDGGAEAIERFAAANGIQAGQVHLMGAHSVSGIIAPDADGKPGLRLPAGTDLGELAGDGAEAVIQEFHGLSLLRVKDPSSGKETLARIASTKTRVMERPAPEPEEKGPGTIPVYLFNAEFN